MTEIKQKQQDNTLWSIADQLRGAMGADDFCDYMLSFLFLRYLSDNYETAAKKELEPGYPDVDDNTRRVPLALRVNISLRTFSMLRVRAPDSNIGRCSNYSDRRGRVAARNDVASRFQPYIFRSIRYQI